MASNISIKIRWLPENTLSLTLPPSTTVGALKSQIFEKAGIETASQRLIFQGKALLVDSAKLEDVGVKSEHVLHLVQITAPPPAPRADLDGLVQQCSSFGSRVSSARRTRANPDAQLFSVPPPQRNPMQVAASYFSRFSGLCSSMSTVFSQCAVSCANSGVSLSHKRRMLRSALESLGEFSAVQTAFKTGLEHVQRADALEEESPSSPPHSAHPHIGLSMVFGRRPARNPTSDGDDSDDSQGQGFGLPPFMMDRGGPAGGISMTFGMDGGGNGRPRPLNHELPV